MKPTISVVPSEIRYHSATEKATMKAATVAQTEEDRPSRPSVMLVALTNPTITRM